MGKEIQTGANGMYKVAAPHFLTKEGGSVSQPLRQHATALICHLHYPELLDELVGALAPLDGDFDLYLSIPKAASGFVLEIFTRFPGAFILPMENIGRDINPFLVILKAILSLGYESLLKIHTKRSPHRADGDAWRQDMYARLLGNRENVLKILQRLAADPHVGIIAPKGHVVSYRAYCGASRDRVLAIARSAGVSYAEQHDFSFVAGTMFWAKPLALESLTRIPDEQLQYEDEVIAADGALVHALERFMGLAVHKEGLEILETDGQGEISQADLTQAYPYTPPSKQLKLADIHKVIFFPLYDERFAIEHLRVTAPYHQAGIEVLQGMVDGEPQYELIPGSDAVIIQREFPRNLPMYEHIYQVANDHYIPIIYDLDDLLFNLPETHPERQAMDYTAALLPMLSALMQADLVTVSTGKLKETLLDFNENIQVLPNYLDDNLWHFRKSHKPGADDKPVVIGYMGSASHSPDLEMIAPVLLELLEKYGERLQFHVWGTELPETLRDQPRISWTPAPTNNYREFAAYFQQQQADIFVAPLADNLFNRCKSGLKYLEYSALGTPGVYSNLDGYAGLITDGEDGFLAESPAEWKENLVRLIEEPALREQMGAKARHTVEAGWLLSKNIASWKDIFKVKEPGFNNQRQAKMNSSSLLHAISGQLFWMQAARNELLTELNRRNGELQGALSASQAAWASEHSLLEVERAALVKEHKQLGTIRETLAKLEASYQAKEKERQSLLERSRLQEEQINALQTQVDTAEAKIHQLEGEKWQMSETINELGGQLQEKETERQRLAGLVDEKVQQNQGLAAELSARVSELEGIKASRSWKFVLFLKKIRSKIVPEGGWLSKKLHAAKSFYITKYSLMTALVKKQKDTWLIRRSELFDRDWYLARNKDVAKEGIDPARHYLFFGGFEGRDPSPKFSSSQYFESYDDVKRSGMNPLLHYLKYGKQEGRKSYQSIIVSTEYISQPEHTLNSRQLVKLLTQSMENKDYVLSISHDNYLKITAGVQLRISDEQISLKKHNISYLHLYPFYRRSTNVGKDEAFFTGVNCDGKEIGVVGRKELLRGLRLFSRVKAKELHIHHAMGFDLAFLADIARILNIGRAQFWVHDYYSVCPGCFLLRNDKVFCEIPDINSNSCKICKYGDERRRHHQEFIELFNQLKTEVVAPSQHALDLWQKGFPTVNVTSRIIPHVSLDWIENKPIAGDKNVLRIGFVGFPVEYKGWGAWKRLTEKIGKDPRFQFFYFSNDWGGHGNYERIVVTVTHENRQAMTEQLIKNGIDVAFLWSICPETFSYTMYESLAAGCFIVTNRDSGNIQYYLKNNPTQGVVLENENQLERLFLEEELFDMVGNYQKDGKPRAKLVFHGGTE